MDNVIPDVMTDNRLARQIGTLKHDVFSVSRCWLLRGL